MDAGVQPLFDLRHKIEEKRLKFIVQIHLVVEQVERVLKCRPIFDLRLQS